MLPAFSAPIDRVRVDRAARWNSGIVIVSALLIAVGIALGAWLIATGFGSGVTAVLAFAFAGAWLIVIVSAIKRRRMLLLLVGDAGTALRIDEHGVTVKNMPPIPWREIVAITFLDTSERTRRAQRSAITGMTANAAIKAGTGTLLCDIVVRDGDALQRTMSAAGIEHRLSLYNAWPDGTRRGVLPLLLDAVTTEQTTLAAIRALTESAGARGIPVEMHTNPFQQTAWRGPLLDPNWS